MSKTDDAFDVALRDVIQARNNVKPKAASLADLIGKLSTLAIRASDAVNVPQPPKPVPPEFFNQTGIAIEQAASALLADGNGAMANELRRVYTDLLRTKDVTEGAGDRVFRPALSGFAKRLFLHAEALGEKAPKRTNQSEPKPDCNSAVLGYLAKERKAGRNMIKKRVTVREIANATGFGKSTVQATDAYQTYVEAHKDAKAIQANYHEDRADDIDLPFDDD